MVTKRTKVNELKNSAAFAPWSKSRLNPAPLHGSEWNVAPGAQHRKIKNWKARPSRGSEWNPAPGARCRKIENQNVRPSLGGEWDPNPAARRTKIEKLNSPPDRHRSLPTLYETALALDRPLQSLSTGLLCLRKVRWQMLEIIFKQKRLIIII